MPHTSPTDTQPPPTAAPTRRRRGWSLEAVELLRRVRAARKARTKPSLAVVLRDLLTSAKPAIFIGVPTAEEAAILLDLDKKGIAAWDVMYKDAVFVIRRRRNWRELASHFDALARRVEARGGGL